MYAGKEPSIVAGQLLAVCWMVMAVCFANSLYKGAGDHQTIPSALRIDPNIAPWWELTIIPDVGPALARNIVEYRERRRIENAANERNVFRSIADLDAVKGIGPKTLARMEPHLLFDSPSIAAESRGPAGNERNTE